MWPPRLVVRIPPFHGVDMGSSPVGVTILKLLAGLMNKNTLKAFANPAFLSMFFLGISCGFPLALVGSVLKAWITSLDISIANIAAFSFVGTPYITKFLWSPFIDSIKIPYLYKLLGQRRSWMLVSQICLMISIVLLANTHPEKHLLICAIAAVIVTFCSATQDIIVDAYRIERFPTDLQQTPIALYSSGYRIGLYSSGVGMLLLADFIKNWQLSYMISSSAVMIGIITTLLIKSHEHKFHESSDDESYLDHLIRIIINPLKEFSTTKKWYYIVIFIILFKLGDALAGNLTTTFLMKKAFTLKEIALYVKTYGLIATLVGLFLGALIIKKMGVFNSLFFAGIIQMLSNLMFVYQDKMGHDAVALILTISTENISGAIGDVVFIAYLSSLCSLRFAATQYALLSCSGTLARNFIAGASGIIVDQYGWTVFFLVSTIAAIPGILMIFKIRHIKRQQT